MAYRSLIRSQTRKAFNLLKDLAEDVTFNEKAATGFNFGTAAPVLSAPVVKIVKGVFIEAKVEKSSSSPKSNGELGTTAMQFICKSEDLGDSSPYSTITQLNGKVWNIIPPGSDNGYITVLTLARLS